ncbi:hypothetical protein PISMIDRAFT_677388 [Pisolithus microcarpus 441]|uniref:Uncharacterized protein n=1 Tax=Pisolithus microcarpus 441 TaxID=765257 RepID=A0A0C9ZGL6_9AGAM|nr:hypothetical protein PISMIDRAFT_677388 [Pisolithus microcarpus 441]
MKNIPRRITKVIRCRLDLRTVVSFRLRVEDENALWRICAPPRCASCGRAGLPRDMEEVKESGATPNTAQLFGVTLTVLRPPCSPS